MVLASEILLPELSKSEPASEVIYIREGQVPKSLAKVKKSGIFFDGFLKFQLTEEKLLIDLQEVGRYLLQPHHSITIDREEGVTDDIVRLYLLGTCLGFLSQLHGYFALHACTLVLDGRCVSFIGPSGVGKSTLAAGLVRRGHQLLADDVSVIDVNEKGNPIVYPAYPQVKLWEDAANQLAVETKDLPVVNPAFAKFRWRVHANFLDKPQELKAIYYLQPSDTKEVKVKKLLEREKFELLITNVYRSLSIEAFDLLAEHFKLTTFLSNHIPLKQIERPIEGYRLADLLDVIEMEITQLPV